MSRVTAFRFTLNPTSEQDRLLRVCGGAARLTYNTLLAVVKDALTAREQAHATASSAPPEVPWTAFDLINLANAWKRTSLAEAVDPSTGQPWHRQVPALVFEEAAVDLAHGLAAYAASRKGSRSGPAVRFPKFKKKATTPYAFRVRNKRNLRDTVRVGEDGCPRSLRLPKLGSIAVREDTRRLRRLLRPTLSADGAEGAPRGRISSVTVRQRRGRWIAVITVCAADLHHAARHPHASPSTDGVSGESEGLWTGVDVGLVDTVVAADQNGAEVLRVPAPKPWRRRLEGQRRRCRAVSRKRPGSANRRKAQARLARYQARTAAIREHHLHQVSNRLVKNHDRLVVEGLHVRGMLANHHLAAALSDAAFAKLAWMLAYKAAWYGTTLVVADRWFPSSKTCSACGARRARMALAERTFICGHCQFTADRDLNAATNLARLGAALRCPGPGPLPDPGPARGGPG